MNHMAESNTIDQTNTLSRKAPQRSLRILAPQVGRFFLHVVQMMLAMGVGKPPAASEVLWRA